MRADIVCAEGELSVAANNLVEYADFLSRAMQSYIAILSDIQEKGIQDDLICSKLSSIADSLRPYLTSVEDECMDIAMDVRSYITEVARADNFKFPADITSTIGSLLAHFL